MFESIIDLDSLGRIVIPIKMRKALNLHTEDQLHIITNNEELIIKKLHNTCVFCGSQEELTKINSKYICNQCRKSIFSYIELEKIYEKEKKGLFNTEYISC